MMPLFFINAQTVHFYASVGTGITSIIPTKLYQLKFKNPLQALYSDEKFSPYVLMCFKSRVHHTTESRKETSTAAFPLGEIVCIFGRLLGDNSHMWVEHFA